MANIGTRPIFPLVLQRLNRQDLDAISTFLQDTITRVVAGMMGEAWGLASELSYELADGDPSSVLFPTPMLMVGVNLEENPNYGGVYLYDPGSSAQAQTSLQLVEDVTAWIWFKPEWAEADSATRVRRSASVEGSPEFATTTTRLREHVEFVATETLDQEGINPAAGYFPFARVAWFAGAAVLTGIHFVDGPYVAPAGEADPVAIPFTRAETHHRGMNPYMRRIAAQVLMILDSGWSFQQDISSVLAQLEQGSHNFLTRPSRGVRQLGEDLTTLEDTVAGSITPRTIIAQGRFVRTSNTEGGLQDVSNVAGAGVAVTVQNPGGGTMYYAQLTFAANIDVLQVTPSISPSDPADVSSGGIGTNTEFSVSGTVSGQDAFLVVSHPVKVDGVSTTFNVYFLSNDTTRLHAFYFSALGLKW